MSFNFGPDISIYLTFLPTDPTVPNLCVIKMIIVRRIH